MKKEKQACLRERRMGGVTDKPRSQEPSGSKEKKGRHKERIQ